MVLDLYTLQSLKMIHKKEKDKYALIFLFKEEVLQWIGKTTSDSVDNYIYEKEKDGFLITHKYILPLVGVTEDIEASNIQAEYILKLNPVGNSNIPKNTLFVSKTMALKNWRITEKQFNDLWAKSEKYEMTKGQYLRRKHLEDEHGKPYHKDIPLLGKNVIIMERNEFEKISKDLKNKNIETNHLSIIYEVLTKTYKVTGYKTNSSFVVSSIDKSNLKEEFVLNVEDFGKTWHRGFSEFKQETLLKKHLAKHPEALMDFVRMVGGKNQ